MTSSKCFLLPFAIGLCAALMAFGLTGCEDFPAGKYTDDIFAGTDPSFDKYPGMNVNTQGVAGTSFIWPEQIQQVNVIKGERNQLSEEEQDDELPVTDKMFGGGLSIIVSMEIQNVSDSAYELSLPAGLLLQAANRNVYQNGILVKKVVIPFQANEKRTVSLRFYGLNQGKGPSDPDGVYSLPQYSTNIAAFQPLFAVCAERKVNINEYSQENILSYYSACETIQEIVYAITQGRTFTEAEIKRYLKHVKKA